MKNIFIIIAVLAMVLSSCTNSSNKEMDTHTHEDGAVHTNHNDDAAESTPNQEVFEVSKDSIQIKNDSLKTDSLKTKIKAEHTHSHEGGKEHKH